MSVSCNFSLKFRKRSVSCQTNNYQGTLLGTHFFGTAACPVPGLVTHFAAKRRQKNCQRETKCYISWMTALTSSLFKRRQATSGTSNATGMCKWKYIWHRWPTYILNLVRTTRPALLCTTGGEVLLYSLVSGKDLQYHEHHKLITQHVHQHRPGKHLWRTERDLLTSPSGYSSHLRLIKGCFTPFQALLRSCQAGSVSRHLQTEKPRGSPGPGTKRRCPGMHGASGALDVSTALRERVKGMPKCFVIPGIHVFSCTWLSF